jgi:glutathione peroxidase
MFLQQTGEVMTKTRAIAATRDLRLGFAGLVALAMLLALMLPLQAFAGYSFKSIDGGTIDLDDFKGHPVLVVNTASLCGFAPQFDDLQALQDTYGDRGLVVLAVSSNDFNQELATAAEVKSYCTANFGLTIPMTDITHVLGAEAHPFYAMLKADYGFAPRWNFNKVLVGPDGAIVEHWGSNTNPMAKAITGPIEALLK